MRLKQLLTGTLIAAFLFIGLTVPAQAQTEASENPTVTELLAMIESLTAQVKALQEQVQATLKLQQEIKTELRETFKLTRELHRGMSGEEVEALQKILATDPSLYPEGLVTGFYGPLTAKAIERLQTKFKLEGEGEVNAATRELINQILASEGVVEGIPPGLLRAPGLTDRIKIEIRTENGKTEYRIEIKCDKSGKGNQCRTAAGSLDDEEAEDEDEEELEIEAEIEESTTKVKVNIEGEKDNFTLDTTDKEDIIEEIAQRYDLDTATVEDVIEFEEETDDEDDDQEEDDSEEEEDSDEDETDEN